MVSLSFNCDLTSVSGGKESFKSWWPKDSIWQTLGLAGACWTLVAEAWFQRQIASIHGSLCSKEDPLIYSKSWRSTLANTKSGRIKTNLNLITAKFLIDEPIYSSSFQT
jgi:hypothetical protein